MSLDRNSRKALEDALNKFDYFTIVFKYLINQNGRKGAKILRVEDKNGKQIDLSYFLANYKIDPTQLGAEFIGKRGELVNMRPEIKKITVQKIEKNDVVKEK